MPWESSIYNGKVRNNYEKIKLLMPLASAATLAGFLPVIAGCSCNKGTTETVELDESVTKQGITLKSSEIVQGKDSTIELTLPENKTISSITLEIGNATLSKSDVTIDGGKITIPAAKMTVAKVTIKKITLEDVPTEPTRAEWFAKYNPILAAYKATYNSYTEEEVTMKINDVSHTIHCIEKGSVSFSGGYKLISTLFYDDSYDNRVEIAGEHLTDDIIGLIDDAEAASLTCKYTINSDSLNVFIPKSATSSVEYTFNMYGYVTKLVEISDDATKTYEITYPTSGIHAITTFNLKKCASQYSTTPMNGYMHRAQLIANQEYTVNLTYKPSDWTGVANVPEIKMFRALQHPSTATNPEGAALSNTSITFTPTGGDWEYKTKVGTTKGGAGFVGTALTAQTTVTIKFKVAQNYDSINLTTQYDNVE